MAKPASYRLSHRAKADLEAIWLHSEDVWSLRQAEKYVSGLYDMFQQLAEMPGIGRKVTMSGRDYQRFDHVSHTIFFRVQSPGIFIVRILHQRMDSARHM